MQANRPNRTNGKQTTQTEQTIQNVSKHPPRNNTIPAVKNNRPNASSPIPMSFVRKEQQTTAQTPGKNNRTDIFQEAYCSTAAESALSHYF
jgi:hypothetical protein